MVRTGCVLIEPLESVNWRVRPPLLLLIVLVSPAVLSILLALGASVDPALDDREVARRIKRGDGTAFRIFFDRYHGLLFGYLRRRGVSEEACEDLIQQAFIAIWERRAEINEEKSLRAFLFKICYNRALNLFRDNAKFTGTDSLLEAAGSSNPETGAHYALMQESLKAAIEQLPERRRAVFELCFLEELTYSEAAEALGISVKTVEHQMGAALKTLREALAPYVE